MHELDSEARIC